MKAFSLCCVVLTRHMFEVEQIDYDKEQIDWSYITFNDNKVRWSARVQQWSIHTNHTNKCKRRRRFMP